MGGEDLRILPDRGANDSPAGWYGTSQVPEITFVLEICYGCQLIGGLKVLCCACFIDVIHECNVEILVKCKL